MNNQAFDIECGPNYFILGLKDMKTENIIKHFLMYDVSDGSYICGRVGEKGKSMVYQGFDHFAEMMKLIIEDIPWLMGFNSEHYDDYMLNAFHRHMVNWTIDPVRSHSQLRVQVLTHDLYELSKGIIELDKKPKLTAPFPFRSIDLKRVARIEKSLKLVGANLKYDIIQDFPISPDKVIDQLTLDKMLEYLDHDLNITYLLAKQLSPDLNLRKNISMNYNINVMSEDRSGIANVLFEKMYSEFTGLNRFDLRALKRKATIPKRIRIADVISPNVKFLSKKMQDYVEKISKTVIRCDTDKITCDLPEVTIGSTAYTLGAGGLHSKDDRTMFVSDSKYIYADADVGSYYPRMMINGKMYPDYLDASFYQLLEKITDERLEAKASGDSLVSETLKIVINSIFGKTGEDRSWFYSPQVYLSTTVNGQLYLLMLAERLEMAGFKVVSANTDGIITRIPNDPQSKTKYLTVTQKWSQELNLQLEYVYYSMYARTTVNDYLAIDDKGKIKTKGDFTGKFEIEKGQDAKVIPKVVCDFLIKKYIENKPVSIEDIMDTYTDIHDYLYAKKPVTKGWENVYVTPMGTDCSIQNTVRFAVVKKNYSQRVRLYKMKTDDPDTKISYIKNEYVGIANNLKNKLAPTIDEIKKDFYVKQCKKMINLIESGNLSNTLELF